MDTDGEVGFAAFIHAVFFAIPNATNGQDNLGKNVLDSEICVLKFKVSASIFGQSTNIVDHLHK